MSDLAPWHAESRNWDFIENQDLERLTQAGGREARRSDKDGKDNLGRGRW